VIRPERRIRNTAICRRYAAGEEKISAIASDYGISEARVVQIAQQGGVPSRNQHESRRRFPSGAPGCVFLPVEGEICLVSVPSACR